MTRFPLPWARALLLLAPLVLGLLHVSGVARLAPLDRLDAMAHDVRLRATLPRSLDPRIVIVDIDEASLAQEGRWPWGRDRLARLVTELFERQRIALLGFDVVFAEADGSSGLATLQALANGDLADQPAFARRLQALTPQLDHDAAFARALAGRPVVLGYYFNQDPRGRTAGTLPAPVMGADSLGGRSPGFTEWTGFAANLGPLAAVAPRAGFFNPMVDPDGVVRAVPLLARHQGQLYESLTLAMLRELHRRPTVRPVFAGDDAAPGDAPLKALRLMTQPPITLPVGEGARAWVPFRGLPGAQGGSFRYVPAGDLLAGRLAAGQLEGRIVLVGSSAPGLNDLRPTPVSEAFPGVEIHAHLLSGMLDGRLPVRPDDAAGYEALLMLVVGLALAWALPRLSPLASLLATAGTLVAIGLLDVSLYLGAGLLLPLAGPLAVPAAVFLLHLAWGHLVESRGRRALAELFGTYVPPELVQQMLRHPGRYTMDAASRELTVMFCDMRGFTELAERMEPLQLQGLLNSVFNRLSDIIREHHGTIDKYMGDCVMAFWGAPVPAADHAQRALRASLAIVAAVDRLNAEHRSQGLPQVAFGIGVSTGPMCVGDMGSRVRRAYTVIGDAVNLGARLQGLAAAYGVDIVASDATRRAAPGFDWQELDCVRLRGRQAPVVLWRPLPAGSVRGAGGLAQELQAWQAFLATWRAGEFEAAAAQLDALRRVGSTPRLYALYLARLRQRADPLADGCVDAEVHTD